ncbi:hypothetical protein [Streptomyces inhibens]|uniref:hypothetical protein n=1 Tax=Streptomyces inhibens TaxID=2293571 RepID=UPI001EE71756|nr:hypothetical protein [Streptomyces inhibens]UKY55620.1 hypothetical protein KI385_42835 [Streptomyces inhibens]
MVWPEFLEAYGRQWDEAAAEDFEAFKYWRMTDDRNVGRVRPPSFDADRAGLNAFYTWASQRYGVANPVTTRDVEPTVVGWGDPGRRRDPVRPAGSPRRQVKWMLYTERLLKTADPNVHHGQGMTCVHRPETALCRTARLEAGLSADGPEESG